MKKKFICKIVIDMIMTILLLFLMARQLTGDFLHEWLGAGMFILWIAHHILNLNWYSQIFKGTYTFTRSLQTVTNFAVLFAMLGLMISGIILSREVFSFLSISGGTALARTIHICSAFWGFTLMALHLGMHWNMILGMVRKVTKPVVSKKVQIILHIVAATIAGYGFYAFIKNGWVSYMFLKSSFVFFDFERPVLFFFTEYMAIMGLFIFLAHYISKGMQRLNGK